jgi:hypothetical protein
MSVQNVHRPVELVLVDLAAGEPLGQQLFRVGLQGLRRRRVTQPRPPTITGGPAPVITRVQNAMVLSVTSA